MSMPKCYAVIPARYGSSRFPGKPLVDILGKPMFWHVYDRARRCPEVAEVILATDDERIKRAAKVLDVPVVMTRPDHVSGTDRVLEAARALSAEPDAVIANVQGDEPCLEPSMLTELLAPFADPTVRVTTLASALDPGQAASPDRVKVVLAKSGNALYFSRAPIPHPRTGEPDYLLHVGLYAFRMEALETFSSLQRGELEQAESLEQLRFLENDIPIRVAVTAHACHGVDREADLDEVKRILTEQSS